MLAVRPLIFAVIVVFGTAVTGVAIAGASQVQQEGTELTGPCTDSEPVPGIGFNTVLDMIAAFNEDRGVTFEDVIDVIAWFNGEPPPDRWVDSQVPIEIRNDRNTSVNVTVQLRCLEREDEPIVHTETVTVNGSENISTSPEKRITIDTGDNFGTYRVTVSAENQSASLPWKPSVRLSNFSGGFNDDVPPRVSVGVGQNITIARWCGFRSCQLNRSQKRFDIDNDHQIEFEEVMYAMEAFQTGKAVGGRPVTFEDVLDLIVVFDEGTGV